jgi:hypothetical protein
MNVITNVHTGRYCKALFFAFSHPQVAVDHPFLAEGVVVGLDAKHKLLALSTANCGVLCNGEPPSDEYRKSRLVSDRRSSAACQNYAPAR